ncbi:MULTISPECIES: MATE family efflux transporter [Petrimonas]|nr:MULTISPECIES: MATE family efflux transporter [Petrimonas]MDD3560929.1 MATE family efflux transporter [Petrimonas mucosa]
MPLMAVSFIQMTYSMVDIIWIGRLGSKSVAAVGTVGMLIWMINSFALLSKVSAEVSIGQSIGAKRLDKAAIYASHTTTIAIILGITFAVFFFLSPQLILAFFRLDADITAEAVDYLKIVSFCIPFIFLILNFSGIYIGSGRSDIPFYFNAAGLLLNIVLDPLFIFGLGPIPMMGSKGAALATTLSQGVVTVLFIRHLRGNTGAIGRFAFWIKPRRGYTVNILKLGIPVAAMNVYFSLINMNLTRIASIHGGHLGVTSQTTGGQIEGVTWNTSQGFATALGSFVAQNFAAGRMDRARHAYRYTLMTMMALGLVVTASFMLFGSEIFAVFIPEKAAYLAGGDYLFIIGISQLFMMLEITTQGMFNGIGKTAPPAVVSIGFNTLRVPLAIFMASAMGVNGVWWAISITSIIKGVCSALWFYLSQRKLK